MRLIKAFVAAVLLAIFSVHVAVASTVAFACGTGLGNGLSNCQSNSVGGIASVNDRYASDEALANYGQLGVASSTSLASGILSPPYSLAIAQAGDDLTINSPLLNGSTGLLYVDYTLDGTIAASGAASSVVQVSVQVDFVNTITAYTSSTAGSFRAPIGFRFTFGQPFLFGLCLGAATGEGIVPAVLPGSGHVSTFLCAPGFAGPTGESGSGTAAFALVLSGLTVTDNMGNPVSGAQFTSASGTQYGPDGVVPEPGPLLMVGAGLVVVAFARRVGVSEQTVRKLPARGDVLAFK